MGKDDDPDMEDSEKRNNFSENCSDEVTNSTSSEAEIKNEASQLCDEENSPGMYVELLSIENAMKIGVVEKSSLDDDDCVNKHRTLSRLTNGLNTSFNSDCDLSTDNNFQFLKCSQIKNGEETVSENVVKLETNNDDLIFKTGQELECVSDDLAVNYLNAEFIENEGMWRLDWFIENTCDAAMAPVNQDDFIVLCYTGLLLFLLFYLLFD